MKQFIVLLAVLPLMIVFFTQFTLDQINESKISIVNECVYAAKENAKQEGGFTAQIQSELKRKLAGALGISESEIVITTNADRSGAVKRMTSAAAISASDWKDKLIYYKISVPIGKMMAGTDFLGIRESENSYVYTVDAYTASEWLD